jgi:hypothetical protein
MPKVRYTSIFLCADQHDHPLQVIMLDTSDQVRAEQEPSRRGTQRLSWPGVALVPSACVIEDN